MQNDIRKSKRGGNAAYLNVGVWLDKNTGHIRLTLPHSKWFHATVTGDSNSVRGHRNLYANLARARKEAGVPNPETIESH